MKLKQGIPKIADIMLALDSDGYKSIAEYHREYMDKNRKYLTNYPWIKDALKLVLVFGIPMYGVLAVFAPFLFKIWLRNEYIEALPGVFQIMLAGSFFALVGIPAYYTTIGFGRISDIIIINIMSAGSNVVLVIGYYALTGHLSVYSIAWCFVLATIPSLAYLVYKTRHLLIYGGK